MFTLVCTVLTILLYAGSFGRVWCNQLIVAGVMLDVWFFIAMVVEKKERIKNGEEEEKR